jgi:hypothetical protein
MNGSGAVVSTWSLLIRRQQRACRQAEIPLSALCRFPAPALFIDKYKTYDWVNDDGFNNIASWIEAAAKAAGR